MFDLHCQSQHPALLWLSIRIKKPAGFLRTLGMLAQVPLGWVGSSWGTVGPVPALGFTMAAGPHHTLLRGLACDSQFEPWCVCTLPTGHLPPPTAAKYSSPTCVRTHLIPGEQVNSPARPKPTEQASWEGSQGPPCPPLPRRASDRQESVPIKVLESGPRAAMQQGLCRQA